MQTYIVDASVAIKWYFDEEGREIALRLIDDFMGKNSKLIVPEIFYPEFANTCRKKVKQNLATSAEVLDIFNNLMKLSLERYSDRELSE